MAKTVMISVAPAPDKATQALEHLLNRKPFDVV